MSGTNGNGANANGHFDEVTCERYLFGELSEPEQERFETAYFENDAFFNRFLAVKDELLDLYARDELDANRKQRLELHFQSTPPRQRRLNEARDFISSLTMVADRTARKASPAYTVPVERPSMLESLKSIFTVPALAGAGLLLLVVAISFWMMRPIDVTERAAEPVGRDSLFPGNSENAEVLSADPMPYKEAGLPARGNPEQLPREPKRPEQPEVAVTDPKTHDPQKQVANQTVEPIPPQQPQTTDPKPDVAEVVKPDNPRPDSGGDRTESVTLSSTSRSATKGNTASIGAATRSVVIRLLFGGEAYASYSVRVTTLGGGTVWRAPNLTTSMNEGAKSIAVTISAASLTRKDYIVVLEGRSKDGKLETIREYYLHVNRH